MIKIGAAEIHKLKRRIYYVPMTQLGSRRMPYLTAFGIALQVSSEQQQYLAARGIEWVPGSSPKRRKLRVRRRQLPRREHRIVEQLSVIWAQLQGRPTIGN